MEVESNAQTRKPIGELMPFIVLSVTILLAVFGQAAWLDGKIERLDSKLTNEIKQMEIRLGVKIDGLQQGQAAIRERLAALESRVTALENKAAATPSRASDLEHRMVDQGSHRAAVTGVGVATPSG